MGQIKEQSNENNEQDIDGSCGIVNAGRLSEE